MLFIKKYFIIVSLLVLNLLLSGCNYLSSDTEISEIFDTIDRNNVKETGELKESLDDLNKLLGDNDE